MNNDDLVELVKDNEFYLGLKSPRDKRVLKAMRGVDRADFLSEESLSLWAVNPFAFAAMYRSRKSINRTKHKSYDGLLTDIDAVLKSAKKYQVKIKDLAYNDLVLPSGYGQTCSQPSMVGFMADILELENGNKVLEIGSGYGYHAAITSHLIGNKGLLVTIEYDPRLAKVAKINIANHFGEEELEKRIRIIKGDGSIGLKGGLFDRIYLTAEVNQETFKPEILARQLKSEGILLFPEDKGNIIKQTYTKGELKSQRIYGDGKIIFVALRGKNC